jgi:hypothetical protein
MTTTNQLISYIHRQNSICNSSIDIDFLCQHKGNSIDQLNIG